MTAKRQTVAGPSKTPFGTGGWVPPSGNLENGKQDGGRTPLVPWGTLTNTWNPFSNVDTTMHLTLGLRDDLGATLDNLCRLSRLGDFTRAKTLFHEELQSHLDKPQVLIRWAETLLRQGDYKSLLKIDPAVIERLEYKGESDRATELAKLYWRLMRLTARYQSLKISVESEEWDILNVVLDYPFTNTVTVGSAEVCFT